MCVFTKDIEDGNEGGGRSYLIPVEVPLETLEAQVSSECETPKRLKRRAVFERWMYAWPTVLGHVGSQRPATFMEGAVEVIGTR